MNKLTPQQLEQLFTQIERPSISALKMSDNTAELSIEVPADLSWFAGHFPEQAVLPGVVQIDWVGKFIDALYPQAGEFRQLSNIKFKTMVLPCTQLNLKLDYQAVKNTVKFDYWDNENTYSTGSFKFVAL